IQRALLSPPHIDINVNKFAVSHCPHVAVSSSFPIVCRISLLHLPAMSTSQWPAGLALPLSPIPVHSGFLRSDLSIEFAVVLSAVCLDLCTVRRPSKSLFFLPLLAIF